MKICIVTRADLLPANHGAAVKIVETARSFSVLGHDAFIATSDRDTYIRVHKSGDFEYRSFPNRFRAMEEWCMFIGRGERLAERLCRMVGYPVEEYFLYSAQFDPAWLIRLVAVGLAEDVDVFQAEFPGYGVTAHLASRIVGRLRSTQVRSSIVQHNVEWARLQAYGHQVERIRRLETGALKLVDDVIAVSSEDEKDAMIQMGVDADSISIIPHGVDVQSIQQAESRRTKWRQTWKVVNKTVVFFHGTLHYAPNTDAVRFIAEQLIPLVEQEPDLETVQFVITGLNPPRYFAHPRITFTEVVDDLSGHLHMADVFYAHCLMVEALGLKLLEYLAVGRPILTTRKGVEGIPDMGQFTYVETAKDMLVALKQSIHSYNCIIERKRLAQRLSWSNVGRCYLICTRTHQSSSWSITFRIVPKRR